MTVNKILPLIILALLLSSCNSTPISTPFPVTPTPPSQPTATRSGMAQKGDQVVYYAQAGDTLMGLAARFDTTPDAISKNNPLLPATITTLPPGLPLTIQLDTTPDWGNPYQIIPDYLFVNGPAQIDFDAVGYVNASKGWLKNYPDIVEGYSKKGGDIVEAVALNYSISPRLLLAVLEYQLHILSSPKPPASISLGSKDPKLDTLYKQLYWAANELNNGYYSWREGKLTRFRYLNGQVETPDPSQNAATVAIQYYFSLFLDGDQYQTAISQAGLMMTYQTLFGNVDWNNPHTEDGIPGDLRQPQLKLPFLPGLKWAYTGGPHTGWGSLEPYAAIDFAPPADAPGCDASLEWATSMSDGVVARTGSGVVMVALDPSGQYQKGWSIFYLHVAPSSAPKVGTILKAGDKIGHPSCDGGHATGRHIHIARRYNGEWIPAGGVLAFNLDGWTVSDGSNVYQGIMTRSSQVLKADPNGQSFSQVMAGSVK